MRLVMRLNIKNLASMTIVNANNKPRHLLSPIFQRGGWQESRTYHIHTFKLSRPNIHVIWTGWPFGDVNIGRLKMKRAIREASHARNIQFWHTREYGQTAHTHTWKLPIVEQIVLIIAQWQSDDVNGSLDENRLLLRRGICVAYAVVTRSAEQHTIRIEHALIEKSL